MLQQALAVALFPEHEVRVFDKIPAAETLAAAELVIVDGAALRGGAMLSNHDVRVVQSLRIPVVWVDAEPPPDTGAFTKLTRLAPPLRRDDLRAAVAAGLQVITAAQPSAALQPERTVAAKKRAMAPRQESAAQRPAKEFIELVDVFEEAPPLDENNAEARNKH